MDRGMAGIAVIVIGLLLIGSGGLMLTGIPGKIFSAEFRGLGDKPTDTATGKINRCYKDGRVAKSGAYDTVSIQRYDWFDDTYDYLVMRGFVSFDTSNYINISQSSLKITAYTSGRWNGDGARIPDQADPPIGVEVWSSGQGAELETGDWASLESNVKSLSWEDGITYETPVTKTVNVSDFANPDGRSQFAIIFDDESYIDGAESLVVKSVELGTEGKENYDLSVGTSPTNAGSVSLDPSGGSYDPGTTVTLTAEPSSSYTFDSWSGEISGTTNPKTITMDSDKSITANFSEDIQYYTLSTSVGGSGSIDIDPNQSKYEEGTIVNLTASPSSGWNFDYWGGDASGTSETVSMTMDSDKSVEAYFTEEPTPEYPLSTSTDPTDGGTVTVNPDQDTYTEGTEVTLTASPSSGYNWNNWSGDAGGTSKQITIIMTSGKSITANFSEETPGPYSLTTEVVSGQGSVEPFGGTYEEGTEVTLQAKPEDGWSFVFWGGDWSGSSNPTTIKMDSDKHITASFNEIQPDYVELTLKSNPNEGGQTTITENYIPKGSVKTESPAAFKKGTVVELSAQPNEGYEFVHWSGDAKGEDKNISVTMNSDKSITAHYTETFQFELSTPILLVIVGIGLIPVGIFLRLKNR